jgi:DNA repair exonuclease SbcCD ATPase subunit
MEAQDYTEEQLSNTEIDNLCELAVDNYKNGAYSKEAIEEENCTPDRRKSMKNDFKNYLIGSAKERRDRQGVNKPRTQKELLWFRLLLDCDTQRICKMKRELREIKKVIKEQKEIIEKYKQNNDPGYRKKLEEKIKNEIDEELCGRLERQRDKLIRYETIIKKLEERNESLTDSTVSREYHDKMVEDFLHVKNLNDELRKENKFLSEKDVKATKRIMAELDDEKDKLKEKYKKEIEKLEEKHNKEIDKLRQRLNDQSGDDKKQKMLEKVRQLEIQRKQLLAECGLDELSI